MSKKPAILGHAPTFDQKVHIVKPVLPDMDQLSDGIKGILTSGMVTKGQHLVGFEKAAADHLGVKHAVAVSSCTTGLMLTYQGLGLTGDVVVPSFTFMATVSALVWNGLRPIYADVDFETTNLNPEAAEAAITLETTAIVAVHNFGNPAEIEALQAVADRHNLKLIFDAAHGFGARYQGVPVGAQGDAQVYSLSPTKLLIAGEGGIVATNHDDLAESIRLGREYGNSGNYDSVFAGMNARMPELNALMAINSLAMLEKAAECRNSYVDIYQEQLGQIPGVAFQVVRPGNRNSYKDLSITIDPDKFGLNRDELAEALTAENIDTRKYYEPPVHRQTAYNHFPVAAGGLPNTERLSEQSLSLPVWSHMDEEIVFGICEAVRQIYESAEEVRDALIN